MSLGLLRVITGIRFDLVIIPTIIFQLGLIAMGPASQQIITAENVSFCTDMFHSRIYYNHPYYIDFSALKYPYDMRTHTGIKRDYLVRLGYDTVIARGDQFNFADNLIPTSYMCDNLAVNCTFRDVQVLSTMFECQPGSFNTTLIISEQTRNATSLAAYYGFNANSYSTSVQTPRVFYSGSMQSRTIYDIRNMTVISYISPNVSAVRPYVGDQTFVVLSDKNNGAFPTYVDAKDVTVQECTLRSYINSTEFVFANIRAGSRSVQNTTLPLDYDLLANASALDIVNKDDPSYNQTRAMLNAYSLQLSHMANLVTYEPEDFMRLALWVTKKGPFATSPPVNDFISTLLSFGDQAAVLSCPKPSTDLEYVLFVNSGVGCYQPGVSIYRLNRAAYYSVCLVLLIPLLWWFLTWIMSVYLTNGVSRGNSQIALLVTGLTDAAQKKMKGLSHSGSSALFSRANQVDVQFGETKLSDKRRPGHVAFGVEGEMDPIRSK